MRKFLVVVFVFSLVTTVFSQSQGFSRWSLTAEYGYNQFDGDINQDLTNIFPSSLRDITYGGTLEFAMTPIWGLAADYYYFPLRANNSIPAALINTNLHTTDLNVTINFTRLIFPKTKSKFYINGSLGLGLAAYNIDVQPATVMFPQVDYYAVTVPVTFSAEYNMSRPLALGARVHYRSYSKDNLEGVRQLNWAGVTNDFIGAGTIYLRYKFRSVSKSHLRNISWDIYEPDQGLEIARNLEKKYDELTKKVETIDAKVDSLIPRIDRLEKILVVDGPDADGDGVPDARDMEPATSANTGVDFWGRRIQTDAQGKPKLTGQGVNLPEDVPAVYFDFDQIELDDDALITIRQIAMKMKADPGLYVEIRGYADNVGSNPYNNLLAQRRTDRVKAELINVWKIPADHIIPNGKGKIIEPRSKYRPNRRCDFFFGKL